jgi:hypothetical protein
MFTAFFTHRRTSAGAFRDDFDQFSPVQGLLRAFLPHHYPAQGQQTPISAFLRYRTQSTHKRGSMNDAVIHEIRLAGHHGGKGGETET